MKKFRNVKYSGLILMILLLSTLLYFSCIPLTNKPVKINSLQAVNNTLYVQMQTELTCTATSQNGDKLTYKWSCDDGTLSGEGQKVKWTSPNAYGDFHIMVKVQDTNGNSDQATTTIKVIYNPNPFECPSCNK
jgi:hypothetical protein